MFSLNIFVYGLFAPVGGTLISRWRPRRLVLLGLTILILATAGCALARELWQFYILFGLLTPLGSALAGWPIIAPTFINGLLRREGWSSDWVKRAAGSALSTAFSLNG